MQRSASFTQQQALRVGRTPATTTVQLKWAFSFSERVSFVFRCPHNQHLTWDSHPVNVGSSIFCFLVSGSADMVPLPSRILLAWHLIYEGWRRSVRSNLQLFGDFPKDFWRLLDRYFCRLAAATGCSASTWKLLRRFLDIIRAEVSRSQN